MKHKRDCEERAMLAYFRRFGKNAAQPSSPDFDYETGIITLSNVNGVLGQYRIVADRLRWAGIPKEE